MRTLPAEFEKYHANSGVPTIFVVHVSDGSNNYYYGTTDAYLTDAGHVYGVLLRPPKITESVDIFSRRWSVSGLNLRFSNLPYTKDETGNDHRVIDDLADPFDYTVKVYVMAGETSDTLSDGLLIYDGIIKDAVEYDETELNMNVRQALIYEDVMLPEKHVSDYFSTLSLKDYLSVGIPVVYGYFTEGITELNGYGLAATVLVGYGDNLRFVICDHPIASATGQGYVIVDEVHGPHELLDDTLTSGPNYSYITSSSNQIRVFIFPTHVFSSEGHEGIPSYWLNPEKAMNMNSGNYGIIRDYDIGTHVYAHGILCHNVSSFIAQKMAREETVLSAVIKCDDLPGTLLDFTMRMTYEATATGFLTDSAVLTLTKGIPGTWQYSAAYDDCKEKSGPFYITVYGHRAGGDGTSENWNLVAVHHAYIRMVYGYDSPANGWAACQGMAYGSWITGRSSNYSSGDVIQDPAGIVESIARDRMDVATANVDLTSFIDCESWSIQARLNITDDNAMTALEAIDLITQQSTFAVIFTADGKLRAVNLNVTSPSSDKTIYYHDLVEGSLELKRSDFIVNDMTILSRWQAEYGVFRDSSIYTDAGSQAIYGTRKYPGTLEWPCILATSASTVANALVGTNTKGLWDQAHIIVTFTTVGLKHIDIEIGDWISFDATSFDPRLKCYGATWGSREFLVTDRRFDGAKGITFTAYELRLGESWT